MGGAHHRQSLRADEEPQRRIFRIHDLENGLSGCLRIAKFNIGTGGEDLFPHVAIGIDAGCDLLGHG